MNSSSSLSRTVRENSRYDDDDLLDAVTDCIQLPASVESTVTEAIKALQHVLKKSAEDTDAADSPPLGRNGGLDEATDSASAGAYLAHFSYGLTPGEARYYVYRFLNANNMNIPKALASLVKTAEFRKKQNLDKMALFPCLISISGYDQAAMCEALRIPFIHNLTSGKRYVDAEGRLRLEQDELDYYNVQYDEIYANLGTTTEPANMSLFASPHVAVGPLPSFSADDRRQREKGHPHQPSTTADRNGGSNSTSISSVQRPANGTTTNRGGGTAAAAAPDDDDGLVHNDSVDSVNNSGAAGGGGGGGTRKKWTASNGGSGEAAPTPSKWRSLFSFHPFGHGEGGSPNKAAAPAFERSSADGGRMARLHSVGSLDGAENVNEDDEAEATAESAATEAAMLLNPAVVGEALLATPNTLYADSLNFHGILEPIVATVTRHVPFCFHYWDREGHPVMYCKLGSLNSKKLMRDLFSLTPVDAEPRALAVLFNTYALVVMEQLIRYCNHKNRESNQIHDALITPQPRARKNLFHTKPLVGSCVVVIDCAKVRLHRYLYKPLLLMVKSIVSLDVRQYPDMLHRVYVTNCRTVVNWSYLMLRGMLSEETRQKVSFCSKHNTAATLLQEISSDLLPEELGGKCKCPGGCIPSIAAAMPDADSNTRSRSGRDDGRSSSRTAGSDTSSMEQAPERFREQGLVLNPLHCTVERVKLWAHGSRTLTFAMEAHSEIVWEFLVKKKRQVTFSAIFVSAENDGAMLSLVEPRRAKTDAGHFICPSLGTVIFEWSNKHSFFRSCRINVKVYREERITV